MKVLLLLFDGHNEGDSKKRIVELTPKVSVVLRKWDAMHRAWNETVEKLFEKATEEIDESHPDPKFDFSHSDDVGRDVHLTNEWNRKHEALKKGRTLELLREAKVFPPPTLIDYMTTRVNLEPFEFEERHMTRYDNTDYAKPLRDLLLIDSDKTGWIDEPKGKK